MMVDVAVLAASDSEEQLQQDAEVWHQLLEVLQASNASNA